MVRVGIFGTNGELGLQVTKLLIDELLDECCQKFDSEEVEAVISHASGRGIGEYVFEEGEIRGVKTVGLVLPSCRAEQWFPVDEKVYLGDIWGEKCIDDCADVMDVIVWVGGVDPKRDWIELSNMSNIEMLSVSDSMVDWVSPDSVVDLGPIVDHMVENQY